MKTFHQTLGGGPPATKSHHTVTDDRLPTLSTLGLSEVDFTTKFKDLINLESGVNSDGSGWERALTHTYDSNFMLNDLDCDVRNTCDISFSGTSLPHEFGIHEKSFERTKVFGDSVISGVTASPSLLRSPLDGFAHIQPDPIPETDRREPLSDVQIISGNIESSGGSKVKMKSKTSKKKPKTSVMLKKKILDIDLNQKIELVNNILKPTVAKSKTKSKAKTKKKITLAKKAPKSRSAKCGINLETSANDKSGFVTEEHNIIKNEDLTKKLIMPTISEKSILTDEAFTEELITPSVLEMTSQPEPNITPPSTSATPSVLEKIPSPEPSITAPPTLKILSNAKKSAVKQTKKKRKKKTTSKMTDEEEKESQRKFREMVFNKSLAAYICVCVSRPYCIYWYVLVYHSMIPGQCQVTYKSHVISVNLIYYFPL